MTQQITLQFVTRRYFYRLHPYIYFGEKSFTDIQYVHVLRVNLGNGNHTSQNFKITDQKQFRCFEQ